ncbi:glycerophosphodiester phosphodiesterase family protein [Nesterenkonia sandarakina]|uniref:Glycerophosphoryl diester phosphodiesterase n=1 Tax=Nesterenkonia sandarakina TaxID=272918 RepID=A0A2T0YQP3_9MICC|nr:glycerophosphodiester phosphodiesterase family protein [Nesterenkonia sandarakina]PRZ17698.1 glycerophosphoryl diester phosphodiesterase [Nesterenkonia sandarakina]
MPTPYRRHAYRDAPYLLNSLPGALHHRPLAFAHRGADPRRENTMGAFRHAVDLGYRYLEIDVRTAADGTLVVFHDEELDRATSGSGLLSEKTWEQLAELRVGTGDGFTEPLVRFEELLSTWGDVHLNVDLKDAAAVTEFARLVEKHQAHDRVLAASFNDARRRSVRRRLTRPVAASGGWAATALIVLLGPLGLMGRLGGRVADIDCVQVPVSQGRIRVVTPRFVQRCHRAGLQVHVWVVDDPAEMHELLDMGVDGLMTDDAEALAEVMRERSVWPQR